MYRIVKEVHARRKPLWLVDLLFRISPSLYKGNGPKEMMEDRLNKILTIIQGASVRWHHGTSLLPSIQTVTYDDTCIRVKGRRGQLFLSFLIEPDYSPLKTNLDYETGKQ